MTMSNKFVFNQKKLEALPFANKGERAVYHDSSTAGLVLRVSETTKTFFVAGRVKGGKGESVKYTIGRFPQIKLDHARLQASIIQVKLNQGTNPNIEKKEVTKEKIAEAKAIVDKDTLEDLFKRYVEEHMSKNGTVQVKKTTMDDIKISMKAFGRRRLTTLKLQDKKKPTDKDVWVIAAVVELDDWLSRPYREITNLEILERFKIFSISLRENNGNVIQPLIRTHQLAFRYLRAVYNFIVPRALLEDKDNKRNLVSNPVDIIAVYKLWKSPNVRSNKLDTDSFEFFKWWKALTEYGDNLAKDYILVSLLQCGRSADVAPLEFANLDFQKKVINYKNTKNGEDYIFPMTRLVYSILKKRSQLTSANGKYVFEYAESKQGYIPKSGRWHFEKLAELSGKKITHHDLRRTFTSIAIKLKIDPITYNFCLKHLIQGVDKHYITVDVEVLREALQLFEDYLLETYKKFADNLNKPEEVKEDELDMVIE